MEKEKKDALLAEIAKRKEQKENEALIAEAKELGIDVENFSTKKDVEEEKKHVVVDEKKLEEQKSTSTDVTVTKEDIKNLFNELREANQENKEKDAVVYL